MEPSLSVSLCLSLSLPLCVCLSFFLPLSVSLSLSLSRGSAGSEYIVDFLEKKIREFIGTAVQTVNRKRSQDVISTSQQTDLQYAHVARYLIIISTHHHYCKWSSIQMFITLVWKDQHSFYLHHFLIIILPILFCVCQISIIASLQCNRVWYNYF